MLKSLKNGIDLVFKPKIDIITDIGIVVGLFVLKITSIKPSSERDAGEGWLNPGAAKSEARVAFGRRIPESMRGVRDLPILQLRAFYRPLAKGLNLDRPNNLTAVVKLDVS